MAHLLRKVVVQSVSEIKKHRAVWVWISVIILLLGSIPFARIGVEHIEKQIYPLRYGEYIENEANACSFPPSLIYAVIHTESHFNPEAVSIADAKGLMQLTDDTYRWARRRLGESKGDPADLFDPKTNIHYGVTVLSLLRQSFSNTETMLAAYNAGQGRVHSWLSDPAYSDDGVTLHTIPYEETADYVRRVLRTQKRYQQIYNIP